MCYLKIIKVRVNESAQTVVKLRCGFHIFSNIIKRKMIILYQLFKKFQLYLIIHKNLLYDFGCFSDIRSIIAYYRIIFR